MSYTDIENWQNMARERLAQSRKIVDGFPENIMDTVQVAAVLAQLGHGYAALALAESYRLEQATRDRGPS